MNKTILACTIALMTSLAGAAYWIVNTIQTYAPSGYALSSDDDRNFEKLSSIQVQLEKIESNTEHVQDSLDELAPVTASNRRARKQELLQRLQRDTQSSQKP